MRFKQVNNPVLLNVLAHDAKHVLSFATLRNCEGIGRREGHYSSIHICAHSVAAAEHLGCLQKFIQWREQCKIKIPNFTKLVLSDALKGTGEKNGRSNAKRRGGTVWRTAV